MKEIFYGQLLKTRYKSASEKYSYFGFKSLFWENEILRYEKFYEYESMIDRIPYDEGETCRINELNIDVKILKIIRSVEGYYIYKCDHIINIDENIEEKDEMLKIISEHNNKITVGLQGEEPIEMYSDGYKRNQKLLFFKNILNKFRCLKKEKQNVL